MLLQKDITEGPWLFADCQRPEADSEEATWYLPGRRRTPESPPEPASPDQP